MTDLATQSLGYTSGNEFTSQERRAAYEDWKASARHTPPPLGDRYTGLAHTERTDDVPQSLGQKRSLLVEHAMKAGHAGEIDQTNLTKVAYHIADEVIRTDADRDVPKELTPELRARLATAALNILEPPMRIDEQVKSPISGQAATQPPAPDKPGSSPLNRQDDEEEKPRKATGDGAADDNEPSLKTVMDAIGTLSKRLDAMEGNGARGDDEGNTSGHSPGAPKGLAADSARDSYRRNARLLEKGELGRIVCDGVTMDEFARHQARADRVYSAWGKSAPRPLHGEELNDYRRRLLKPYQHHSPVFVKSNLKVLAVDDAAFNHAEDEIWKAASDAVRDPSTVPLGLLRESTEVRNGHTHTRFYGRPMSWMAPFMVPGKRVKRINKDVPSSVGYQA